MHRQLEMLAEADPHAVLVSFFDRDDQLTLHHHTRQAMVTAARRAAALLQSLGCHPGDRVAVCCANRVEFLHLWFACSLTGVIFTPINIEMRGGVLRHMLSLTRPKVVFADEALTPILRPYVDSIEIDGRSPTMISLDSSDSAAPTWSDLMSESHEFTPAAVVTAGTANSILFTSGTTGVSKAVTYCHGMVSKIAEDQRAVIGSAEGGDVMFTPLPLFHGNALHATFATSFMGGDSSVFASKFSATRFWSQVAASRATVGYTLGSITAILWKQTRQAKETAHALRICVAVPAPVDFREQWEQRFRVPLTQLYGLSDFGIPIGVPFGEREPERSAGRPLPGWECRIVDEHDQPMAEGEVGELLVRTTEPFSSFLGYWAMPEATVAATRNLWYHTGDLFRSENGWYFYIDRKKDAIRRMGENISSFEVEEALLQHPAVVQVAVYGVPSDLMEDEVMAAVLVDSHYAKGDVTGESVAHDLIRFASTVLPAFAVPRYVRVMHEFPMTQNGKVRKEVLKAEGKAAAAVDAGERHHRRVTDG
jgi:crotonobetaine/carnitine-CoA ligase